MAAGRRGDEGTAHDPTRGITVVRVEVQNTLGVFLQRQPFTLSEGRLSSIQETVNLPLNPLTGHYGGMLRRRRWLVHWGANLGDRSWVRSRKGVLCGVATEGVSLVYNFVSS